MTFQLDDIDDDGIELVQTEAVAEEDSEEPKEPTFLNAVPSPVKV